MKASESTLVRAALSVSLLFTTIGVTFAQSQKGEPIAFHYLKSVAPGDNSALSGECDGTTASAEITCRFTQLIVSYQLKPKDVLVETEKRLALWRTIASGDVKKLTAELCGARMNRAEAERLSQENKDAPNWVKELVTLCSNPNLTMAALEGWIRRSTLAESKTCRVAHFENDPVTYKKIAPTKWVANVGPKGLCSFVYLYAMENDPEQTNLWKWSQERTYADTSIEVCKKLMLSPKVEFSWQGEQVAMTCEHIKFGL